MKQPKDNQESSELRGLVSEDLEIAAALFIHRQPTQDLVDLAARSLPFERTSSIQAFKFAVGSARRDRE